MVRITTDDLSAYEVRKLEKRVIQRLRFVVLV